MNLLNLAVLCGLWIGYFVIHSILASEKIKNEFNSKFQGAAHAYRLLYNLTASILLLPLIHYVYFVPSQQIIEWSGILAIAGNILALSALAGFIYSLKFYGGMEFLGLTQFRAKKPVETPHFVISPLHRFVRHPWYLFALIIIWTRDMNLHFLLSACLMTAYFFIGSYYEEQKMKLHFGKHYEEYMAKVPRIIPDFKRHLTSSQASNLTEKE